MDESTLLALIANISIGSGIATMYARRETVLRDL